MHYSYFSHSHLRENQFRFSAFLPQIQISTMKPFESKLKQCEQKYILHVCKAALLHCKVCFVNEDGDDDDGDKIEKERPTVSFSQLVKPGHLQFRVIQLFEAGIITKV